MARNPSWGTKIRQEKDRMEAELKKNLPKSIKFIGQDIELTRGVHVIYFRCPPTANSNPFIALFKWIAAWSSAWDGTPSIKNPFGLIGVKKRIEDEWNKKKGKPNGLTLRMPEHGRQFKIKQSNGQFKTIDRKGYDSRNYALYVVVELI